MGKSLLVTTLLVGLSLTAITQPAQALDRRVTVINQSSYEVCRIHATNRDNDSWGRDILPGILSPGYQITLNMSDGSGYCIVDMRAVGCNGEEWTKRANVCELVTWTLRD